MFDDANRPQDIFAVRLEYCLRVRPAVVAADHPVVLALLDLYVSRLRAYVAMAVWLRLEPVGLVLRSQLVELQGWAFKRKPLKLTEEDNNELVNLFVKIGFSHTFAQTESRRLAAAGGRRPSTRRPIAIAALEEKLRNPSLTWIDVTDLVCQCGKQQHDSYCWKNLEEGRKELRRLFRKYDHPLGLLRLKSPGA